MTIDKIKLAGTKAKGQRPYFLSDKQTEQVMSIAMALAMELNVARERAASLEAILVAKGILGADELDSYQPGKAEVEKRSIETSEYLARILRIIQQDKEGMIAEEESIEDIQKKLCEE